MSGQQIGTVVGGVIGSFIPVVGTQLGAVIGGMIGGWVDPTKVYGPRLSDATQQTAMDGVPRVYGQGTFPCTGNLIWIDPTVKEHKHTDDGKGSGQEQITYTYTRSYAIGVCKGQITGYKLVKRNGKVVFDARTDAELTALGYTDEQIAVTRAAQAKFLQKCTFYYGTSDQMPDPTMVAVEGVGNVPAYRGTAYIVMTDDDTNAGEVAQFEFVVANCGDRTEDVIEYVPVRWDEETETGGGLDIGQTATTSSATGTSNVAGFITADRWLSSGDWYWEATTGWYLKSGSGINHYGQNGVIRQSDQSWGLVIRQMPEGGDDGGAVSLEDALFGPQLLYEDWIPPPDTERSALIRNRLAFTEFGATWSIAIDDGPWIEIMPGMPGIFSAYACSRGTNLDAASGKSVTIYSMPDDLTYDVPEGALPLSAARKSQDISLPDAPGFYINRETGEIVGPHGTQISVCKPTLGEVVSAQCAKRVSTSVIDVSELSDEVVGFRVASPSSPQKNITALMPGYFFDGSEFDGVLHFPKRGGEDSFALTYDDLCERDDGDPIQWERTQEPELLRKVTVNYIDPDTTYTVTTQQWERRSGTVKAEGEGTIELPIVGGKDWAAQAAHMNGKVAWGESDKCTFHTSIAQAKLVTAAVGTITDENGTMHRVRIERIEDEGLKRMVEARRTRSDLYDSTVTGAEKPLPRFPGSNIRGPTDGLLLNIPVMVDSNDVPGMAWAAAGYLSGWVGTVLQVYRAGQWVEIGRTDVSCTMGTLMETLPAHAGDIDTANVMHVRMNEPMESVTFTNLLQERNPLAIVYPDGATEIVQFQTATEVAAGEYELTTLLRGRLATQAGEHAEGARVVFLDTRVKYALLEPTDIGTTLTYRFVSMGTDPDAAPVQTLDLTTMESQREWPVFDLQVEQDGDDYIVTWRKRDRLGTDVFPIRSTNWRGYEVSWSYGGNTHTETVLTESVTFTLPGASDITFSVAQLNLYTGAGPAETVTIP